jgi:glycosyltransferase involved in cell wall biosynthesis
MTGKVSRVIAITPFYNVGEEIVKCIKSLKSQNFTNFEAYFIDDMSTDNTVDYYRSEVGDDTRFNIIVNTEKKYGIRNIIDCIDTLNLDDDAVILQIDGDDFLYDENSIHKVIDSSYCA